jgi:hypothetical protein
MSHLGGASGRSCSGDRGCSRLLFPELSRSALPASNSSSNFLSSRALRLASALHHRYSSYLPFAS